MNHLVPKQESVSNLRCLDFSDVKVMQDVAQDMHNMFPNADLFAVGFSLGGNYVLKAAGAPGSQGTACNFKAIATVS